MNPRSLRGSWRSRGGGSSVKNATAAAALVLVLDAAAIHVALAFDDGVVDPAGNRALVPGPL